MTPPELADDCDGLHLELDDTDALVAALRATCADEGFVEAAPASLPPPGSFAHGEEDPAVRRFLVTPPAGRWTTVLMSACDWDHSWTPGMLARLPCRAAHLMVHDGDTCTLHLFEGADVVGVLVTSPAHFDRPGAPRDPRLRGALEAFVGRALDDLELEATCHPPGRLDVDGRLAFERLVALLELPPAAGDSYARALGRLGDPPVGWQHLAFARVGQLASLTGDDDDAAPAVPGTGGSVLPFRRPRAT